MKRNDEKWSLFWCTLLHPIIFEEIDKAQVNRYLGELSEKEHLFPDGRVKKPGLSTLRRKLNQYRQGGFKALARKGRSDRGTIRSVSQEILDKAVELKKEQPLRSDETINRFLRSYYGKTIAKSTLYRHLKQAGATKIKLGISKKKVRKRFSREHTHELWVGDFEEGPYVLIDGEVLPTYLCLFIDCHSRYVVEGRYYLRQSLDILIDSLLRAWAVHGSSRELYVDNAKVYHANALKAACYSLHIKLSHRPPKDPAAGGLVERVFGTLQSQFEAEVRAGDILSLNALNRALSAYLAVAYHQRIHGETGQSPQQRYQQGLKLIRHVDMQEVVQFFMKSEVRTVDKDFSDIRLNNCYYRVDPKLRGDKVDVRYDPFCHCEKVRLYSLSNAYLGQGTLYNRDRGAESQQGVQKRPKNNYLALLIQEHDSRLHAQSRGIDYRRIVSKRPWPFVAFLRKLAKLMGRSEALGAFNSQELEMLKKAYNRTADLNESKLQEAWTKAAQKTIPHLLYQLHRMKKEDK